MKNNTKPASLEADGWIVQEYLTLLRKGQSVYIYPDCRHLDNDPSARLMLINIITPAQKARWEKLEAWAFQAKNVLDGFVGTNYLCEEYLSLPKAEGEI